MEGTFNLKDFVINILRKWRIMLGLALFFAILLGGIKFAKGQGELKAGYTIQDAGSAERIKTIQKEIKQLQKDAEASEKYYLESRISDVDIFSGKVYSLNFRIKPNADTASDVLMGQDIAGAFADYINKGTVYSEIEGTKENAEVLPELIRAKAEGSLVLLEGYLVEDMDVEGIMESVYDYVKANPASADRGEVFYTLEKVNSGTGRNVDFSSTSFSQMQENVMLKVDRYQSAIDNKKKLLETLKSDTGYVEVTQKSVFAGAIKFGVVGGCAGVILGAFLGLFGEMMSNTLRRKEELVQLGLACIADMSNCGKKRNVVDRWIDKLAGFPCVSESMQEKEQIAYIAECIKIKLEQTPEVKRIFITASSNDREAESLVRNAADELGDDSFIFEYGNDIQISADTLKKVSESDGIIFAAMAGSSKVTDIAASTETLEGLGKKIIGCVMV